MLRPGGAIAFCGEPSRYGDRLAAAPKRAGMIAAPAWRRLVGAQPRAVAEAEQSDGHALEGEVDVHAFAPADLRRLLRDSGFEQRRVGGEELLANAWGWGLRTVEVERRARIGLLGLAPLRLQQLHRPAEGRHPPARAPPPRRALLQPPALRPQAGLSASRATPAAMLEPCAPIGAQPLIGVSWKRGAMTAARARCTSSGS